jgi:hypothetical protein
MQSNRNNKTGKPKFIDVKMLIAALAVAITVGFWNLASNDAYTAEKSSPSVVITLPPQTPSVAADNLPPLPTLVPLVDVTIPQINPVTEAVNVSKPDNQAPAANNTAAQPQPTTSLRVVGIPTLVITQNQKPVFGDQISAASQNTDNSSGSSNSKNSSNGSKSSSSPKSSSTTKSSKK